MIDIKSKINPLNIGITILILVLFWVAVIFWYWQMKPSELVSSEPTPESSEPAGEPVVQSSADQESADISLGSQILVRTQNLIQDKFPETNPLKQITKNPF